MMSIRTKPQDLIRTCRWGLLGWGPLKSYRFSAFWLRSKCSICSYQLNIWYGPHWGPTILNWFLNWGEDPGACFDFSTGRPGLAVPPGMAHSPHPWGNIPKLNCNIPKQNWNLHTCSFFCFSRCILEDTWMQLPRREQQAEPPKMVSVVSWIIAYSLCNLFNDMKSFCNVVDEQSLLVNSNYLYKSIYSKHVLSRIV